MIGRGHRNGSHERRGTLKTPNFAPYFGVQAGKSGKKQVAVVTIEMPDVVTPSKRHTVLVVDCSGSMDGYLGQVRRDLGKYVSELGDSDFVSVITFSGHAQSRLIAGPTQCNADGRKMVVRAVENGVRAMGTTVFSEPLELTLKTVERLAGSDTLHSAMLFTDGCAVPTAWNVAKEHDKSITVAQKLGAFGAMVSVIGYGVHYDEDFMRSMVEESGHNGVYRHISEIEDFGPAIHCADEVFRDMRPVNVDLRLSPATGSAGTVYKTTPDLTSVGEFGTIRTRGAYQGKITLFVELSEPCTKFGLTGTVNGTKVILKLDAQPLSPEAAKEHIILRAAHAYILGRPNEAESILSEAGEHGLAEKAGQSYTKREQRETADDFRRYFRDRKHIGEGLKPTGPSNCVLNVMRAVIEDAGNVVYLKAGAYARSGELTRDPRVVESPHGRSLQALGYVSSQKRFNFSFRCKKDVKVLPEDGHGPPIDSKVWRTYNVVLDGNLHIPEFEAVLTAESFTKLQAAGAIKAEAKHTPGKAVTIDLRGIKMISPNWANPATLGLVPLLQEEAELEAEQKALNARRKTLKVSISSDDDDDGEEMYREKAVKVEGLVPEYYDANCVEIRLMKYKAAAYDAAAGKLDYAQADARVKVVRQRLATVRYTIRAITFAMEVTKSEAIKWGPVTVTKRGAYPKQEQLAQFKDATLKRATWVERETCS